MAQDYYDEYDNEYDEYDNEKDYGYPRERVTDEDVWYALTDGMYGDYPGPEFDYEWLGF